MTFREAILPLIQFISEEWETHQMSVRLRKPTAIVAIGLLLLSLVLMRALSQNNSRLATLVQKQNENLTKLDELQTKVDALQKGTVIAQTNTDVSKTVLGATTVAPTPTPLEIPLALGMLQVNSYPAAEKIIYDSPSQVSTVETVKPGTFMLYYKKEGGWYQVDPPTKVGMMGWIQQDNLTEVPNVTELPQ